LKLLVDIVHKELSLIEPVQAEKLGYSFDSESI